MNISLTLDVATVKEVWKCVRKMYMFYLTKRSCIYDKTVKITIQRLLLSALPRIYVTKLSQIKLFYSSWNDLL